MELFNKLVDLPGVVNAKLPANHWNSTIESSEKSLNGWIGSLLHILAVVFVVMAIIGIVQDGIDSFEGQEGMTVVGSIVTMLLFVYVAFPLSQFIRSAGDSLASSNSGIIEFLLKDLVVAMLKLGGYSGALIALAAAAAGLVSFLLDSSVFAYGFMDLGAVGTYMMEAILMPVAGLVDMGGQVSDIMAGMGGSYYSMISVEGWSLGGATQVIQMFIQPLTILIMLYVTLAVYGFGYSLAARFLNWVKGPSLPIKMV